MDMFCSPVLGGPRLILILGFWPGPEIDDFGGSKESPPTAKPIGKGGGLRPPPFPMCFAMEGGRL